MAEKQMWCRSGAHDLCDESRLSCGCWCHRLDSPEYHEFVAKIEEAATVVPPMQPLQVEQPDMFEEKPPQDVDKILAVARDRIAKNAPITIKAESLAVLCDEVDRLRGLLVAQLPDDDRMGKWSDKAPDTQRAAALDMVPRSGTQRMLVLRTITASTTGMTDDEVCEAIGILRSSVTPRRLELKEGGWIEDSGKRRATGHGGDGVVWFATDKTRAALVAKTATVEP